MFTIRKTHNRIHYRFFFESTTVLGNIGCDSLYSMNTIQCNSTITRKQVVYWLLAKVKLIVQSWGDSLGEFLRTDHVNEKQTHH